MASLINEREVFDLETGMFVPQHMMLKTLMERAHLTRKQLHLTTKGKLNSNRTASWLSDIFRGDNRHLSMRDIVPVIKAFKLSRKDEDHYIAEFFKAHCDKSLQPFIKTSRQSLKVQTLEQRISELENHINSLTSTIYYEKHVVHKYKVKKLENNIKELMNSNDSTLQNQPIRDDFKSDDEFYDAMWDWKLMLEEQKINEYQFQAEEQFGDNCYLEDLYNRTEESLAESDSVFKKEKNQLLDAIIELEMVQINTPELSSYIRAFLPANFDEQLINLLSIEGVNFYPVDTPQQAWSWLDFRVETRPKNYVLATLLSIWKSKNERDFELSNEYYKEYFATDFTQRHEITRKRTTDTNESFSSYLADCDRKMRKEYPILTSILKLLATYNMINHGRDEKSIFELYQDHSRSGLDNYIDFFKFYESNFPSSFEKKLDLQHFFSEVVCFIPLKIDGTAERTLANVFADYGDAELHHENVVDFLISNVVQSDSIEVKLQVARELAKKQIQLGESQHHKDLMQRLRCGAASIKYPEFDISNSFEAEKGSTEEAKRKTLEDILETFFNKEGHIKPLDGDINE